MQDLFETAYSLSGREKNLRHLESNSNIIHKTRAVIHMGPHKTGTTSIQTLSKKHESLLNLDGYAMPWAANLQSNQRENVKPWENQVEFATCFLHPDHPERKAYPCNPDLLLHGLDIAAQNQNLFVSAETFENIDNEGIDMLHSYLSHWDEVVIVIYYRRFHDRISSSYRHLHDTGLVSNTIIEFVQTFLKELSTHHSTIVSLIQRKFENVVIVNYHDKSFRGSGESFYCNAMPDATHMCDAIKSQMTVRDNARSSRQIGLQDLIQHAMGFQDSDRTAAKHFAEKYVEETKNLTMRKKCMDEETKEKLWQATLDYKQNVYPGDDEDELKTQFEKDVLTKLCAIDVDETLKDEAWKSFFQSLSEEYKPHKN